MGMELPGLPDVERAMDQWRIGDPRLQALCLRYGAPAPALRHYGLILWQQGEPAMAAQVLSGAVALAPADARVWTDLAGALNAAGHLPEAAACIDESLRRDPVQPDGWVRLGSIRGAMNDAAGAETALRTALALDADLADAHLSLGLLYFQGKRFEEAIGHFDVILEQATPAVRTCHAQALAYLGRFESAASAFEVALAGEPDNTAIALKLAHTCFICDVLAGPLETAVAACRARPAVTVAEYEKISRQAFHLLAAFGHRDAALRLGAARLAEKPEDPERAYLLAVLRGETMERSPDRYVASFFNQFAGEFDKQLVDVLGYSAYRDLVAMVEDHATDLPRVLDLGCGTGLAGPLLAGEGRHLTGIDLSTGMLAKARERGCYGDLIEAEAVAYLGSKLGAFDLVFAADMLIYVGALTAVMERAADALAAGGLFALTIESAEVELALLPSGRFAHGLANVLSLAETAGFAVLATRTVDIRYETHGFVAGELIVLRKRGTA